MQAYNVIGVMSGTSLDGIDLVYAQFSKADAWDYQIFHAETCPYSKTWKTRLKAAHHFNNDELEQLDKDYTFYLSQFINSFIEKYNITSIDLVASHGHTILHQPHLGRTLQIGNRSEIAKLTRQTVVCDFRVQDVRLGGQGAPLVPIGDELLFSDFDYCLNLGGFANLSFKKNNNRIAYDICPVNKILNAYAEQLGFEYDQNGKIAKHSEVDSVLLDTLHQLEFYKAKPPKSLGTEWLETNFIPVLEASKLKPETIIATCTRHFAQQIASQFEDDTTILATGGGAFNTYLVSEIQKRTSSEICIPKPQLVNYKEALIFGFLGILRQSREINVLSAVTGAKKDHSSGQVFRA